MSFRLGALVVVMCAPLLPLAAAANDAPPLITATGTGEVKVAPDEAIFEITIESLDKDIAKSRQTCESRVKKILEFATQHGLTDKEIQTDRVSIEPETEYHEQTDHYVFLGYRTRFTLALTLHELSKYEALLADVLQAPVDRLNVEWRSSGEVEHRAEARRLPVLAAGEKAVALAAVLEQEIGSAHNVIEKSSGYSRVGDWRANVQMMQQPPRGGGAIEASPGLLSITAQMEISFVLFPREITSPPRGK